MSIIDRINNNLSAFFDIDDEIYRRLISDNLGTNPETFTLPTDIDIGILASQIEWLRRIKNILNNQIYLNSSEEEFLKYILETFFNSKKLEDESDEQWINRAIATVFQQKCSRAAIIVALRDYSSPSDPRIESLIENSGFMDFSFMDAYNNATFTIGEITVHVLPAIMSKFDTGFFSIKITLQNTLSSDIYTVIDIINKVIAAGISYTLYIEYT